MAFQISKEKVEGLSIKDCLFEGWEVLKGNPVNVFIAFIFFSVGSIVTLGILSGALYAGFISYILKLKNKDASATPTDVFSKLNILLPSLLVFIVIIALTFANNLIIGGIFGSFISFLTAILVSSVSISFSTLSIPLLGNGKVEGASEAIQTGWNAFLLSPKTFFLLAVAANILIFVGILCLGIGVLVTAPLTVCMMAVAFEKLSGDGLGGGAEA